MKKRTTNKKTEKIIAGALCLGVLLGGAGIATHVYNDIADSISYSDSSEESKGIAIHDDFNRSLVMLLTRYDIADSHRFSCDAGYITYDCRACYFENVETGSVTRLDDDVVFRNCTFFIIPFNELSNNEELFSNKITKDKINNICKSFEKSKIDDFSNIIKNKQSKKYYQLNPINPRQEVEYEYQSEDIKDIYSHEEVVSYWDGQTGIPNPHEQYVKKYQKNQEIKH